MEVVRSLYEVITRCGVHMKEASDDVGHEVTSKGGDTIGRNRVSVYRCPGLFK